MALKYTVYTYNHLKLDRILDPGNRLWNRYRASGAMRKTPSSSRLNVVSRTARILAECFNRAVCRHLDGAQAYNNEDSLGAGIKAAGKPRSELYIVTKLKQGFGAAQVKPSLVESLQKLGAYSFFFTIFFLKDPATGLDLYVTGYCADIRSLMEIASTCF